MLQLTTGSIPVTGCCVIWHKHDAGSGIVKDDSTPRHDVATEDARRVQCVIQTIRVSEQAFDFVKLMAAEVNAADLAALHPHAPYC